MTINKKDIPLSGAALRDFLYLLYVRTERDSKEKKGYKVLDAWHNREKKWRFYNGKWQWVVYTTDEGHNGVEEEVVIDGVREKE